MELKPCPFCGCKYIDFSGGDRWAMCTSCLSEGPVHLTREKAAIAWNTRYTDPLIEEMAENIADHYCKDELMKEMVAALEELDDMFDPSSRVGEIINKPLQKYHDRKEG